MRPEVRHRLASASRRWTVFALLLLLALGCNQGGESADGNAQLIKRGKVVYETSCTACHARAPAEDGPVGPAIAGSSLELLQAKVLRNEYPPGYKPKRDSNAMVALPHVEPDLPAIHAYLATFAE